MNIFFLDYDPELAALYHVDKHVTKMIVESAQLMCTAVNHYAGSPVTPYKSTHLNHPCGKWIRESLTNFEWVYELMIELNDEYKYRYDKTNNHLSFDKMIDCDIFGMALRYYPPELPRTLTPIALAMPDNCKMSDPVLSYREYYNLHKVDLFKWTKRSKPNWVW